MAEAKRAQAIDPLSAEAAWDTGLALFFGGRRGEAIEQFKSAIDLNPELWLTHSFLAWAYADGGDYDRAFAEYAKARALNDNTDILSNLTWTYAKAGRRTEALQTLETMLKRSKTEYVSPFYIGVAYYSVGDKGRAFAWLEKAYAERAELLVFINVAPIFAPLHDDPRFVDLVRRIGVSR